ncbi:hypothetical protein [Caballeronia sp. GAFFF1]|uniref:hypothetical protein n=1 Tax=Caballeronia sp. GAFFF1 TaxID=2921779 RepID=UPI002027B77F|nr:hypothetical protein [Caballeronia sp. GAFFF1]
MLEFVGLCKFIGEPPLLNRMYLSAGKFKKVQPVGQTKRTLQPPQRCAGASLAKREALFSDGIQKGGRTKLSPMHLALFPLNAHKSDRR